MKLKLELVPKTSWYTNLRKLLNAKDWSMISRYVRDSYNRTCMYCGFVEDLSKRLYTECHEVWTYKVINNIYVQQLDSFECLCKNCHLVHHWGYANASRKVNMDSLTEHACKVNNCTYDEWTDHICESSVEWLGRSEHEWKLDTKGFVKVKTHG